jgi:hypothetical protein
MTTKQAFDLVRALGLSIRRIDGEYRITVRFGTPEFRESVAAYCRDIYDAVGAARAIASYYTKIA